METTQLKIILPIWLAQSVLSSFWPLFDLCGEALPICGLEIHMIGENGYDNDTYLHFVAYNCTFCLGSLSLFHFLFSLYKTMSEMSEMVSPPIWWNKNEWFILTHFPHWLSESIPRSNLVWMVRSDHPARATRASTVHRGQYRTVLFEWINCNSPAVLIRTRKWIVNTCSMIPQRKFQPFKNFDQFHLFK